MEEVSPPVVPRRLRHVPAGLTHHALSRANSSTFDGNTDGIVCADFGGGQALRRYGLEATRANGRRWPDTAAPA